MSGKHIINKIQVTGGFLEDINIEFSDKMNCIIGARGTGKTTLLEFIRFAFDLNYNRPEEKKWKKIRNLINANLSTGQIKISITNSDGFSYKVESDKTGEQIVLNEDGEVTSLSLKQGTLFRADIYSQDQIEEIADKTKDQIELIDQFQSTDIQNINNKIFDILGLLKGSATNVNKTQQDAKLLFDELQQIPEIENQLKKYKKELGDDSDEVNTATAEKEMRDGETTLLSTVREELTVANTQLNDIETRLSNILPKLENDEIDKGKNAEFFKEFEEKMSTLIKQYVSSISDVTNQISSGISVIQKDEEKLTLTHKIQEKGFQDLLEQHKEVQIKSQERLRLASIHKQLKDKLNEYEEKQKTLASLNSNRSELYEQLIDLREDRYIIREKIVNHLDSEIDFINISIKPDSNTDNYSSLIVDAVEGSGTQSSRYVPKIVSGLHPKDFFNIVQNNQSPVETLIEKVGINTNQAKTVVERLKGKEILFDIQTVELLDEPLIQLLDGGIPKKSTELSKGQKCTAILPILLLQDTSPLLIDQPEDNLDNAFISNIVVNGLEKVKQNRQLIFITHNPNIPVLAECERVVTLKSNGKNATIEGIGNLDETQDLIELYLEGGHKAFLKRAERYSKDKSD